ncbi:MAG: S41 family peptidase [Bacteroidales bacterium]
MKKYNHVLLPILIAISIALGIFIGNHYLLLSKRGDSKLNLDHKMSALLEIVKSRYVDSLSMDSLVEQAIPKVLSGLDPHSVYISAKDLEAVNEDLEGSFSGIGVQFNIQNDTVMIVDVISGGPSERLGLLAGDRIVEINDTAFVGKTVSNEGVMKRLRGKKGTKVKLGVKRSTSKSILSFTITRGDIPVNSIDIAYQPVEGIGYIRVNKFASNTYEEFLRSLAKLSQSNVKGIIVDLRGNSGGYMDAAINMINEFLPKDRLIVYTEGENSKRVDAYSDGKGSFKDMPITVLIDEWSASASEIFAGAIQDNDRGIVIGRRSYGKGLVQQQIALYDGSAIRLTIARYHVPSGRCIQKEYKLGDDESYEEDILNRFKHGEFDSKDSIKLNHNLKFETIGGRAVYGGGGIMPDIFVPRDTVGVNSYFNGVVNRGILYQFCFKYADDNRSTLNNFKDYNQMVKYLDTQNIIEDFVSFAESKGVRRRPYLIQESESLLVTQIYAYVARNILGDDAFYPIFLRNDKAMKRAVNILKSGESYPIK